MRPVKSGGTGVPPVISSLPFLEKDREIKIHERNLPHWQQDAKCYFLTWRLADSLPAELLIQWREESDAWLASKAQPLSTEVELEYHRLFSDRIEEILDSGRGSCLLKDSRLSEIVEGALKHFDGERYDLHAFVVMPNHVHVLFTLREGEELSRVMHSWKSFSAHEINKATNQTGCVWQEEYFDRIVRDQGHFSRLVGYIKNNPAKAGLKSVEAYTGGTPVPPDDVPLDQDLPATPVCFAGEGFAINSGFLDGMSTADAKAAMIEFLEAQGSGRTTVTTKLRDWLFSRQRYWGEPFPILWEDGRHRALPETELPVIQPEMADFKPTGTSEPPLAKATGWVAYSESARRETNTMPQWAGSCWYYLRFCDARLETRLVGEQAEQYWMSSAGHGGVDLYVGGTEHAVLHLLYARFWHKVLFDLGHVSSSEPFRKLVNQGMILGPDGQKMSKSRGNVVTPEHVISEYGADSLRLYEMFMGPLEQMKPWSMKGVEGVYRFLARVWRLAVKENQEGQWEVSPDLTDEAPTASQRRVLHATIKKVTEDFDAMAFNTAIAQLMVGTNEFVNAVPRPVEALRILLPLLSPLAPHVSEELWQILGTKFAGFEGRASTAPWPVYDPKILEVEEIELILQINGKLKDKLRVGKTIPEEELVAMAMASPKIQEAMTGKTLIKTISVPGKLVNLVVK
ncbi:MAG: class I tRNA ligase family protein [Terrimicrobiaceae bacterium]